MSNKKEKYSLARLLTIPLFTAIMVVCAWITIPMTVPMTMLTFGVFLSLCTLGGKDGTIAIALHLLLGAIGLPVFSNFSGGLGKLLGATGGYITAFLVSGLLFWLITAIFGNKRSVVITALLLGMLVWYLLGTLWYCHVYSKGTGLSGFVSALGVCVFPFVIPDLIKLILAYIIGEKVKKIIK